MIIIGFDFNFLYLHRRRIQTFKHHLNRRVIQCLLPLLAIDAGAVFSVGARCRIRGIGFFFGGVCSLSAQLQSEH